MLDYIELLERWNATYNLTAVRDPAQMVTRHLLDSLAVGPHVIGESVADLGSGAGLPGVPLAITQPHRHFLLVEANGKKARFLREVVRRLALDNTRVVEARAESTSSSQPVSCVVARALASLADLTRLAGHWLAPGGQLLAMKGPGHADELHGLSSAWQLVTVHKIAVPGLDGGRFLVVLRKT